MDRVTQSSTRPGKDETRPARDKKGEKISFPGKWRSMAFLERNPSRPLQPYVCVCRSFGPSKVEHCQLWLMKCTYFAPHLAAAAAAAALFPSGLKPSSWSGWALHSGPLHDRLQSALGTVALDVFLKAPRPRPWWPCSPRLQSSSLSGLQCKHRQQCILQGWKAATHFSLDQTCHLN